MIEAVFIFAALTAALEWIILEKLDLHTRVRALNYPSVITALAFTGNLVIHWGTMTGSMTAVTAALVSMGVVSVQRKRWGYVFKHEGRIRYMPGSKTVNLDEIR